MLAVLAAVAEAWLRIKVPFTTLAWETREHPVAGFTLKPGQEFRVTNHYDFWNRDKANSLGFADREPVIPKPAGTYRILLVGDSVLEAMQVPLERKLQTLLERQLRDALRGRAIDVVAMGYSGTGQSAQLSFYEAFGRALAPDLVILLMIENDFGNNSPVIESVTNGWHPYHAPILSYEVDPAPPKFRRVEIDKDWIAHVLSRASANRDQDFATRIRILRREPAFAAKLEGWRYPDDLSPLDMFCAGRRPAPSRRPTRSPPTSCSSGPRSRDVTGSGCRWSPVRASRRCAPASPRRRWEPHAAPHATGCSRAPDRPARPLVSISWTCIRPSPPAATLRARATGSSRTGTRPGTNGPRPQSPNGCSRGGSCSSVDFGDSESDLGR
jgi:hypothetical protein